MCKFSIYKINKSLLVTAGESFLMIITFCLFANLENIYSRNTQTKLRRNHLIPVEIINMILIHKPFSDTNLKSLENASVTH